MRCGCAWAGNLRSRQRWLWQVISMTRAPEPGPFRHERPDASVEGLIADGDGKPMDGEGLRVVPEAAPDVEERSLPAQAR